MESRGALTATHETIGRLLDDPDVLRSRPPLDVDLNPTVDPAPPERVPDDAVSVVTDVPDGAQTGGDPWGPGSWAQVSAAFEDKTPVPGDESEPAERFVASGRGARESDLGDESAASGEPVVVPGADGGGDDVFEPRAGDVESGGRGGVRHGGRR